MSILAVTPAHLCNAQIAIAAARAGEVGVLDLSDAVATHQHADAIQKLAAQAGKGASWGCRWNTWGEAGRSPACLTALPRTPWPMLWLAAPTVHSVSGLAELLQEGRKVALRVMLEVTDVSTAIAAATAGFDGVVVVGNEAGGIVSGESLFVLLQQLRGRLSIPYWVRGGIGPETAAAAIVAGAEGVVLAESLWLAKESPFTAAERDRWRRADGSETLCRGTAPFLFRYWRSTGSGADDEISQSQGEEQDWWNSLRQRQLGELKSVPLLPLGQEVAFAATLADRHHTVAGILSAVKKGIDGYPRMASLQQALSRDAPLAAAHTTQYPILQGPMTRVSDVAPFCQLVAEHGGLPFLALGLMKPEEVQRLLDETREALGDRSWGVGLLGFVPQNVRQLQWEVVRAVRPRFALVAGGQPRDAVELEAEGITTYLHVPSPTLLEQFVAAGARRFVLEGRECGGHVGPRSSFVLWQSAIDCLASLSDQQAKDMYVIFAGGIHDALSAAMVATLAAPLVARGIKIGVLMGTAYLFTDEIVASGAITAEFQQQALSCQSTVLLESGLGHASRCIETPFAKEFQAKRRELIRAGKSDDEIRYALEMLNVGRLRAASKGVMRGDVVDELATAGGPLPALQPIDVAQQRRRGMYMIGQVAALRNSTVCLEALHRDVAHGSLAVLEQWVTDHPRPRRRRPKAAEPIAIVGMAGMFPQAANLRQYWQNIIRCTDVFEDVPRHRWNIDDYYSDDRFARDRVYSRRGGFLGRVCFDPMKWRIAPATVKSIDPIQLMALEVAWDAFEDAGYTQRDCGRQRTGVIFAVSGGNDLGAEYCFRTMARHYLPLVEGLDPELRQQLYTGLEDKLAQWTEDSFPGILGNLVASRIANRLDLCGATFVVDAACASSFAALQTAIEQLRLRTADTMLVGGVDGTNNPVCFMSFAKTHALSPRGISAPFDDAADGIVLGEGIAAILLKRLDDAVQDGDKIYAVIRGIGSSSDGRHRSLTAPYPPGQVMALRRAYDDGGVRPSSVSLIEAHGTGTTMGDSVEIMTLQEVFGDGPPREVALGSVKSMIGHTKTVAGLASLIKSVLAIRHRLLPATLGVQTPNRQIDFDTSSFYLNTETRPWIRPVSHGPRRAGISAFGFGGTNFHVVLEEYSGDFHANDEFDLNPRPCELFYWQRQDAPQLVQELLELRAQLPQFDDLGQLAFSRYHEPQSRRLPDEHRCRLAIVASSISDLDSKLQQAVDVVRDGQEYFAPLGVFYSAQDPVPPEQVAFLYPGQGSQSVNMLRDLLIYHAWGAELFEAADRALPDLPQPLSRYIYPPPRAGESDRSMEQQALTATEIAQPALCLIELFGTDLLASYGLRPGQLGGHSLGEYVALAVAGVIDRTELLPLAAHRGQLTADVCREAPGGMVMVAADERTTRECVRKLALQLEVANLNSPEQTILAGTRPAVEQAAATLQGAGLMTRVIPVSAAFHCSAMRPVSQRLRQILKDTSFSRPLIPIYSNTTARHYPGTPKAIRDLLTRHIVAPVRFCQQIENMYAAGARLFIEVGPGHVLSHLVQRILTDRPHQAWSLTGHASHEVASLAHCLGRAAVLGLPVQLDSWFAGRGYRRATRQALIVQHEAQQPKATDWHLWPHRSEPVVSSSQPELRSRQASPLISSAAHSSITNPSTEAAARLSSAAAPDNSRSEHIMNHNTNGPSVPTRPTTESPFHPPSTLNQWFELQRTQLEVQRMQLRITERLLDASPDIPLRDTDTSGGGQLAESAAADPRSAPSSVPHTRPPVEVPGIRKPLSSTSSTSQAVRTAVQHTSTTSQNANGRATSPNQSAEVSAAVPAAPRVAFAEQQANAIVEDIPSTEEFRRDLLNAISQRTGYPIEMLDEDLPLESGLGIDSIKAVEIFGSLKKYHEMFEREAERTDSPANLHRPKTIREMVANYDEFRQRRAQAEVVLPDVEKPPTSDSGPRAERLEVATETTPLEAASPRPFHANRRY